VFTRGQTMELMRADAHDTQGHKIGSVGQVYLDSATGVPAFITVHTGLFGQSESFVPLARAVLTDGHIVVPYDKDQVKSAPRIDPAAPGGGLTPAQERELYRHYGLAWDESARGRPPVSGAASGEGMTRSEERLETGTRTETTGTARLRKYVVTEQQQITVPVKHEEARVVREPLTDANPGDIEIGEAEQKVTLHAERAVVTKQTVPVERVRLETDQVTGQETVSGAVRKERIEAEGVRGEGRDADRRR
jgi:uncharacterized protein (TIGR02271 family)